MEDTKKQFIIDLFAAWNSHDLEHITGFYAPHCEGVDIAQADPQHGIVELLSWIDAYLKAVPDIHFICKEIILEANRAVAVWQSSGTHRGSLMRIPPTNKEFHVQGVTIFTIEGNKVSHMLNIWDVAGLLRDLGLLTEL